MLMPPPPGGRTSVFRAELGDPRWLEVVADVLTVDAVTIEPGTRVEMQRWGGPERLSGRVDRVEPGAFTDISALGVEEQRVNVVIELEDAEQPAMYERLGDAYRVDVQIIIWEAEDVLQVPTGALLRHEGEWAVFVIEAGRAVRRHVTVGQQTALMAGVVDGLARGERVIVYPGDAIEDGTAVELRD